MVNAGAPTILLSSMSDLRDRFICNMAVGINGSGSEAGIATMLWAFMEPNISGVNGGFLRSDAFLALIVLSDEQDEFSAQYGYTDDYVVNFFDNLKRPSDPEDKNRYYSISAAVNNNDPPCGGFTSYGGRYISLAQRTGGVVAGICGDFAEAVTQISQGIAQATSEIRLNREPIETTIRVYRDGREMPQNSLNGWSYNASRRSVQFHGSYIPTPGQSVSIYFNPAGVINPNLD